MAERQIQKTHDMYGYYLILRFDHHKQKKVYMKYHRVIWEDHFNCCLLPWIILHHKNGDKRDNRIENLEPTTQQEHSKLHHKIDMSGRICIICGTNESGHWRTFQNGFRCHKCYMKEWHKINGRTLFQFKKK